MKKANKAVLSLTLAFAVSTLGVAACTDQGAVDDRSYRGAGQYQGRGNMNNYTIDTYDVNNPNRTGIFGNNRRNQTDGRNYTDGRARGLFTSPRMNDGYNGNNTAPGGLFYGGQGYRMGNDNQNGMFGGDNSPYNQSANLAQNDQQRAQQIKQSLLGIPGVENCNVVVNGNDVVAGVDTNGQQGEVMNQVRQKLQSLAPNQDCYVTTDKNLMNRLGNMDGLFQNDDGTAGQQFKQLINDIGNKITR